MSTRLKIPKSAVLDSLHSGIITKGPNKGKQATIKLWRGYASKGYHSNYELVPCVWIEFFMENMMKRQAFSHSGRCIKDAERDFEEAKSLMA